MEADECEQRVAIGRMARQILLESCHRFARAPAGMQRNGIDVGISRPLGIELGSLAQLCERVVGTLEAGQREAERMPSG